MLAVFHLNLEYPNRAVVKSETQQLNMTPRKQKQKHTTKNDNIDYYAKENEVTRRK